MAHPVYVSTNFIFITIITFIFDILPSLLLILLLTVLQKLGDCIGKGAVGKVFKGFNSHTGDMCAIKQIKTTQLSPKQLAKATV